VEIDLECGGRLAALEVAGLSLLVPREPAATAWGCYPMAPWAGRIREGRFGFDGRAHQLPINFGDHAIHGTTFERSWRDAGSAPGVARLTIELGPDWPFTGHAVQEIALQADGLRLRLEVRSDAEPFPASLGWHPWFRRELGRGGPADLSFAADWMYARDASGIPSGDRVPPTAGPWDDCFTGVAVPPRLRWPGALALSLESSADHWVVYDEPAHALCVEPMTGPPDALNLAPRVVTPDDPLTAELVMRWSIE
jgi:aldose 1-epimerase